MPWTSTHYPASMKNLSPKTRKKAIEIANALLADGSDERRAIAIATAQAERWAGSGEPRENHYHVTPHPRGWAVQGGQSKRASAVFQDKMAARDRALNLARKKGVYVLIHDAQGGISESIAPD